MKVVAPRDVYLPAVDDRVEKGEDVDLPTDVAESLLEQGWTRPKTVAAKKAAKSPRVQKADPDHVVHPNPEPEADA